MTSVANYIRRRPKDKLNILTFPTHQRYETQLAKTGHNFYAAHVKGMPPAVDYGIDNYHLMPFNEFYPYDDYDLILSQNRFGQFDLAWKINTQLKIPIITLEHTVPTPDLSLDNLRAMGQMQGDVNVFICENSMQQWASYGIRRNNNVIKHCVDLEVFKHNGQERGGYILTVANDFKARDYCLNFKLWAEVNEEETNDMVVLGKNSDKINEFYGSADSPEELAHAYSCCSIYLNTTSHSPVPMSLLEAMACECPIITTNTCGIGEFIVHEENGIIANTAEEINAAIKKIRDNPEFSSRLGKNARATVERECSEERFINEWNELFTKTYEASL